MPPKRKKETKTKGNKRKKVGSNKVRIPANKVKKEKLEDNEELQDPEFEQGVETEKKHQVEEMLVKKNLKTCKECNKSFRLKQTYDKHINDEHSTLPGALQCQKCPVRCPNKKKLEIHIAKFHMYECPQCKKTFAKTGHVFQHMVQTGCSGTVSSFIVSENLISCKECNKKFRFKTSHDKHLTDEHSKLPGAINCEKCPARCPDKKTLQEHVNKFHDRDMFECPQCKKTFVRTAHVFRHMAQTGCNGTATALFPCEICGAKFSRKDNLLVHLRMQHINRKEYRCKQCLYSTSTYSKLFVHMKNFHSEEKQKFECDHCGKVVTSRPAMCKHLEIHGEKKYSCDVCGYSTFTIEVLRRHVLTHVEEKPYKCELCDNSFIQRSQLLRHLDKHGEFACNLCDDILPQKNKLMTHIKEKHSGENATTCMANNCPSYGKKFNLEEFQDHLKKHASFRPYACEVCGRRYRNVADMRRHVASHTLERPRRCMYCVQARAYVRGMQLVKHVRKVHPSVFKDHLTHVRQVLGSELTVRRVKQSELESILNVLDAEADRILEGYGEGVLYGGMQETGPDAIEVDIAPPPPAHAPAPAPPCKYQNETSSLMSEEELSDNLNQLLVQLIDKELLECFGWPTETVDTVLEKVIEHCGAKAADRDKWTRVQCLRENTKHLFLYVIEDKNISRMLGSHTIDQIVKHILTQVSRDDEVAVVELPTLVEDVKDVVTHT